MRGVVKVAVIGALLAVAAPVGAAAAASGTTASILQAGVVSPSDVPSTWGQSKQPNGGIAPLRKIGVCQQYAALVTAARRNPFRLSPAFSDPSRASTGAENTVYAFKNAATATRYLHAVLAGNVPRCIQASLQQQVGNRGQVGPLTPIGNLQGVGDQSAGYESVITVPGQGTLVVDDVAVRVGRAFAGFTFTNQTTTLPYGLAILHDVVDRLNQVGA